MPLLAKAGAPRLITGLSKAGGAPKKSFGAERGPKPAGKPGYKSDKPGFKKARKE